MSSLSSLSHIFQLQLFFISVLSHISRSFVSAKTLFQHTALSQHILSFISSIFPTTKAVFQPSQFMKVLFSTLSVLVFTQFKLSQKNGKIIIKLRKISEIATKLRIFLVIGNCVLFCPPKQTFNAGNESFECSYVGQDL